MAESSIGFGHNPFGNHGFGFGDWAEEMLWKNMPEVYKDCDETGPVGSAVQIPLRKFQNALKASYQDIRIKWHQFPSLWDAIKVPLDQLPQLAYNVGTIVDPTKNEGLQRSSVRNAGQLRINKGTDKGYEITAAFEGLLVTITPLWAETCGPSSLTLGTIGSVAAPFDLSTKLLEPRPISPGTLHIVVTTPYGTQEDITDIVPNIQTLEVSGVGGSWAPGDIVTQGVVTGNLVTFVSGVMRVDSFLGGTKFVPGPITGSGPGTATVDVERFIEPGNLVGAGNQLNGPLTRLNGSVATTLTLTSITGLFRPGDGVSQGGTTGVIIASSVPNITVETTSGSFVISATPLTNTTITGSGTITAILPNVITAGETIVGQSSGATAVMRDFRGIFSVIDRISTLGGFTPGEYLLGSTSGQFTIAGTAIELIPGPLRARLDLSGASPSSVGDEVTGITSGAVGIVEAVSGSTIFVELITKPGFQAGETLSAGPETISVVDFGIIDYISGQMTGITVPLQAGSSINSVVDLRATGPTQFLANFDDVIADIIPLDNVQSDRYSKWPFTLTPVRLASGILTRGECRSYSLRLFFFPPDNSEIEVTIDVARRIDLALEQFRPLHVRFDKISFDGNRASSQVWRTGPITSGSAAVAVWSAPVTGAKLASSQVWTTGPFSATVST